MIKFLGISITTEGLPAVLKMIDRFIDEPHPHHVVTVNPEYLIEAERNHAFLDVLRTADLALADGGGVIFMANILGQRARLRDRVTGVRLTEELLSRAFEHRLPVMIVLKHNSLTAPERLLQVLQTRFPTLRLVCVREPVTLEAIKQADPAILFAAQGAPQQDLWLHTVSANLPNLRIAVGVGGTFDFISGTIKRAPQVLQSLGLEWLWRLLLEPKRLPRIMRAVIVFPLRALRYTKS